LTTTKPKRALEERRRTGDETAGETREDAGETREDAGRRVL
jgi:hypothetical protein